MTFDLGDGYFIRQATADDHDALRKVCLKTGAAGEDATASEDDPGMVGMLWAVPYQVYAPEFAFVIDGPGGVGGYVLGALDTQAFNVHLAEEWYPKLRLRGPDPGPDESRWTGSDHWRRVAWHPSFDLPASLAPYPSHGHIDLLPHVRGRGFGRRAMETLTGALVKAGSPGMHLGVSKANTRALGFYAALGFVPLQAPDLSAHVVTEVMRFG